MYTIILVALIGFLLPIISELIDCIKYKCSFSWDTIFLGFITSIMGSVIGLFIAILLPCKYENSEWSRDLMSLKDNTNVRGSFFLGSGQINGEMKFVYYVQYNDSSFKMWQASYYDAVIKYTSNKPQVVITDRHQSESLLNKFAIDLAGEEKQTYVFEIPKNSIKDVYELDSQ